MAVFKMAHLSTLKAATFMSLFLHSAAQKNCQYRAWPNSRVSDHYLMTQGMLAEVPGPVQGRFWSGYFSARTGGELGCNANAACYSFHIRGCSGNFPDCWLVTMFREGFPETCCLSSDNAGASLHTIDSCVCPVGQRFNAATRNCVPCANCAPGSTSSGGCTGTLERTCKPCAQPAEGRFVVVTCNTLSDTNSQPCTATCPANTWKTANCSTGTALQLGSNTQCRACTAVCGSNQYITENCTRLTDAVCGNCSACAPLGEEYTSRDCRPSETRDRECTACPRCASGSFTNRTCSSFASTTCASCEAHRYSALAAYESRLATDKDEATDLPTYGVLCGDGSGVPARVPNRTGTELVLFGTDEQRTVNSTCWNGTTLRTGGWDPDFRVVAASALHRSVCYNCWVASRVLTPLFVMPPKFDRSNRLMNFQCVPGYQALVLPTQPRNGTADTGIGVYTKKCYSSGGDNVTIADSVLNGAAPLLCKCRDIPGAHNCSSDTTQEKWIMDGADSFTRHTYVHNRWMFDPTNPENRGQILASFQPYMRMIDGGIEEFYLSDTLSDLPNGRLVFLADNLALGMTILVRTAGNSVIRLDQDVDLWFGSAAALSNKNPAATTAAAITMGTDGFYFDMRFHRMNGLTRDLATGARKAYFDSISRTVNDIRPNEFTPAWGIRLEWLYRKCEPGTYQVGDECVPCADLTCTPLRFQTAKKDGGSGCRPCVCGGAELVEETACFNCTKTCACGLLPDACHITNQCRARNEPRSGTDVCNQCRPDQSQAVFTALTDPDVVCDDGDLCTRSDSCKSGICIGDRLTCLSVAQTGDITQACEVCGGNNGCVQDPDFPGCIAVLDDSNPSNRTCGCLIGDQCFPHLASNPDNFCEQCDVQLDPTGWSFKPPVDCDDGMLCTYGDVCQLGKCAGIEYTCLFGDAPCLASADCNGRGQCDFVYKTSTTLCSPGDGVCLQDRYCSGSNGFCPPKPALIPSIIPGDVNVVLADGLTPVERGWPVSLAEKGSPYLRALYLSVTNWTVICGSIEFSVGWYTDGSGTIGCDDSVVDSTTAVHGAGFSYYAQGNGKANAMASGSGAVALTPASFNTSFRVALVTALNTTDASSRVLRPAIALPPLFNGTQPAVAGLPGYAANASLRMPSWVVPIVKARNVAGREWAVCLGPIAVDNSPPVPAFMRNINTALPEDDGFTYSTHSGTYLSFTWDPFAESLPSTWGGLLKYSWAVGTSPGASDIYPRRYAGIGANSATTQNEVFPPPYGVDLYVSIRGHNRAGLFAELRAEPVLLDPTPPVNCSVTDGTEQTADQRPVQQSFTSNPEDVLSVTVAGCADPETAVTTYEICWGTAYGQCDTVPPQAYRNPSRASFNATTFKATEVTAVVPGQRYFPTVRVVSGSGATLVLPSTAGRVLDLDAPRAVGVLVQEYVASASYVDLLWTYEEAESTLIAATVTVRGTGTRERGRTIVPGSTFTGADIARSLRVPITGRFLLTHSFEYQVCARLTNAANLTSEQACAVFIADLTPVIPPTELVLTHPEQVAGDAIIALDNPSLPIALRWTPAQEDISGISSYSARVLSDASMRPAGSISPASAPGNGSVPVTEWSIVKTGTLALIPAPSGKYTPGWTYWVSLRVVSGTGEAVELTSRGLWISDGKPPSCAVPFIIIPVYPTRASGWWGQSSYLHAAFPAIVDQYAGISDYSVAVGDCGGFATIASVKEWTSFGSNDGRTVARLEGLALTTGQPYCISVRATSYSGLVTQNTSRAFYLDLTPPVAAVSARALDLPVLLNGTIIGSCSGPDIDYSNAVSGDSSWIAASWPAFSDPESGISSYWVCAGRAPGVCDITAEVDAGNTTAWVRAIPTPSVTTRVFVTVFSMNQAGLRTNISTDGVILDPRPPVGGLILYRGLYVSEQRQASLLQTVTSSSAIPLYSSQASASPIRLQLSGFIPAGTVAEPGPPITAFLVDVGTIPGGTQLLQAMNVGLDTEIVLPTVGNLTLTASKVFCVSVRAISANTLSVRVVQPTCLVYDPTPAPPTQARISLVTSQSQHMPFWPVQDRLTICVSGAGDVQSGLSSTTVTVGMAGWGGVWAGDAFTVTVWSNRMPGVPEAGCATLSNLFLRTGIKYVATVSMTNGAGLVTNASTPAFIVDGRSPAPAELLLPVRPPSPSLQLASVYVQPSFQSLGAVRLYFTAGSEAQLPSAWSGLDGVEFWASLGAAVGADDVTPWRRVTAVTRTTIQGPVAPLVALTGLFNATPPSVSGRTGRWLLSLRVVKQSVSSLIGNVPVDSALLDFASWKGSAVGAVLVDPTPPAFPGVPVILPSSFHVRVPSQLVSEVAVRALSASTRTSAIADPSQLTVVWTAATLPAATVSYYRACLQHVPVGGVIRQSDVCLFLGSLTYARFEGLSLVEGQQYKVQVSAVSSSNVTGTSTSPNFIVDSTPPVLQGLPAIVANLSAVDALPSVQYVVPEPPTGVLSMPSTGVIDSAVVLQWNAALDNLTTIRYSAAIGSNPCGVDVLPLTPVNTSEIRAVPGTGLLRARVGQVRLMEGQPLYVSIIAIDEAGNSARACFDGEAPVGVVRAPLATGLGLALPAGPFQANQSTIVVSISHSGGLQLHEVQDLSPGSVSHPVLPTGLSHYLLCVTRQASDVGCAQAPPGGQWRRIDAADEATLDGLTMQHGVSYVTLLQAVAYSGLRTTVVSPPVAFDGTPPAIGPSTLPTFIGTNASITLQWSQVAEDVSQLATLQACVELVNDTIGWDVTAVSDWVPASLSRSGAVRIPLFTDRIAHGALLAPAMRACNTAGLCRVSRDRVFAAVDLTPPTPPASVRILASMTMPSANHSQFITSGSTLNVAWGPFADAESGMASYSIAVGLQPGGQQIRAFLPVSAASSLTLTGLVMEPGARVYVTVQGMNRAGLTSWQSSPASLISPLRPTSFQVYDGALLDMIAEDPIPAGRIGVGLGINTTCITYVEHPTRPSIICTNSTMAVYTRVPFAPSSDPLASLAGERRYDAVRYKFPFRNVGCHWTESEEVISGLSHYLVAIGTARGRTDTVAPVRIPASAPRYYFTRIASAAPSGTLFCTVTAVSNAGLSRSISSDGSSVDRTPPILTGVPRILKSATSASPLFRRETDSVSVAWPGLAVDPESGLAQYQVALVVAGGSAHSQLRLNNYSSATFVPDGCPWVSLGPGVTSAILGNLTLKHSTTYFAVAQAINPGGSHSLIALAPSSVCIDNVPMTAVANVSALAVSLQAYQDGLASIGLARFDYLAQPSLVDSLAQTVNGSAENTTLPSTARWRPVLTANMPWTGVVASPDNRVCVYNNRPGELPVTAKASNRRRMVYDDVTDPFIQSSEVLSPEWATSAIPDRTTGILHGSLCGPGYFRSPFGLCAPCPPGTFKDGVNDATECTVCGANTWFQARFGQFGMGDAARSIRGSTVDSSTVSCACLDFSTQEFNPADGSCVCKPGYFLARRPPHALDMSQDPSPPSAPDGSVRSLEKTWCMECTAGSYKAQAGDAASLCLKCPPGTSVNSARTGCDCNDPNTAWHSPSGRCACMPGMYLESQPKDGGDPTCVMCIGRLQYKDVPGDGVELCQRCPFGTEPDPITKAFCVSIVAGMVYEHTVGGGRANKGYCPAGTTLRYLGTEDVTYDGMAWAYQDPVHGFEDWERTEAHPPGVVCYQSNEDFDTGDEYFDLGVGAKLWDYDAVHKGGWLTREVTKWDIGAEHEEGFMLPYGLIEFDKSPPSGLLNTDFDVMEFWSRLKPRHRTAPAFQYWLNWLYDPSSKFARASELFTYWKRSTDDVQRAIGAYQAAVRDQRQADNPVPAVLVNPFLFFPDGSPYHMGMDMLYRYDEFLEYVMGWMDKGTEEEPRPKEELDAAFYSFMDDCLMRAYNVSSYQAAKWAFEGARVLVQQYRKEGGYTPTSDENDSLSNAFIAGQAERVFYPIFVGFKDMLIAMTLDNLDWYRARRLTPLAAEMEMEYGSAFDGDLQLWAFTRNMRKDVESWGPLPFSLLFYMQQGKFAGDSPDDPSPRNDEGRLFQGRLLSSGTWARYYVIMKQWRDSLESGVHKLMPEELGAAWKPSAGNGLYTLSRKNPKCSFKRPRPVHACVPCSDGTIQPWPIALDTGFWQHKRQNEGVCTACPAFSDSVRNITAGPAGSLGAVNFFLVANLTRLHLDWAHVWNADDLSGLRQYNYALGSVPGGNQYLPMTPVRPSRSTSVAIDLSSELVERLGFQAGAPIFVSVQAVDIAGNVATYADTNPVVWDPNGPLPGDIKDASLDEYIPPTTLAASGQGAGTAPPSGRRLAANSGGTVLHGHDGVGRKSAKHVLGQQRAGSHLLSSLLRTTEGEHGVTKGEEGKVPKGQTTAGMLSVRPAMKRRLQFGTLPTDNVTFAEAVAAYDWKLDASLTDVTYVIDMDHWTDPTRLEVTYEAFSSLAAGVSGLSYCVGSKPYACDILPSTAADAGGGTLPTANTLVITDLSIPVPSTVYVTVTAVAGSGLFATVTTDGIRVDNRPPYALDSLYIADTGRYSLLPQALAGAGVAADSRAPPIDINCDAAYAGVGASWSGFVAPLGVLQYEWCIGKQPRVGSCDYLPWTSVGLATAVYNASVLLPEGTVYFVSVRVTDAIGQTLGAVSDGVRVLSGQAPVEDSTPVLNATQALNDFLQSDAQTTVLNASQYLEGLAAGTAVPMNVTAPDVPRPGAGPPPRFRFLCELSPASLMLNLAPSQRNTTSISEVNIQGDERAPVGLDALLRGLNV